MKKSIIAVVFILVLIATLPIIGNNFLKNSIDDKVAHLQSFGVEVQTDKTFSKYLSTRRHFEFNLKESTKFIKYINQYSEKKIPLSFNTLLDGLLVGVDVKYSNLPFAKSSSIEIYPLSLSSKIKTSLKENNPHFYNYINHFFQSKGVLCHINYNLINEKFDASFKDIDELYSDANNRRLNLSIKKLTLKGKGEILSPNALKMKVKKISLRAVDAKQKVEIYVDNWSSSNNFKSENSYTDRIDVKKIKLLILGVEDDISMSVEKLNIYASSSEGAEGLKLNSKTSLSSIYLASNKNRLELKKFNIDVTLDEIDKELFKNLKALKNYQDIDLSTVELLSKGVKIEVLDMSVQDINIKNLGDLKGFSLKADAKLKKDGKLVKKFQENPLKLLSNLDIKINFILSKKMFKAFVKSDLIASKLHSYAREQKDSYIFDISFIDSKSTINGKVVQ